MPILLKSNTYQVIGIQSKTTSKFFKNLKIGSLLKFEVELKHAGSGDHGTYATCITVTNVDTKETVQKTFNQLSNILNKYELSAYTGEALLPFEPTEKEMLSYTE